MVELSHDFIREVVEEGDLAIDATLGNGFDALFLANLLGDSGRLIGFDVQLEAVERSQKRVEESGFQGSCRFFHASHDKITEFIQTEQRVSAFIYNLGYLPGSDRRISTSASTTIDSLEQAINLLDIGGRIAIVSYAEHLGGQAESTAVERFVSRLDPSVFRCFTIRQENLQKCPQLAVIHKKV